jgi:hypothetical protein
MREVAQYLVGIDTFLGRWDWDAPSGVRCCVKKKMPPNCGLSLDDWLRGERINAKRALLEIASDGVETSTEIVGNWR